MPGIMSEVRKFHQLVDKVDAGAKTNPEQESGVAEASQFLEFLDITGKLKSYTPTDWQLAGKALGLTEEEINPWMEDGAAWIVDTTDSKGDVAPSAWGGGAGRSSRGRSNPEKVDTCRICVPDCPCDCLDCESCPDCVYCGCCCIC